MATGTIWFCVNLIRITKSWKILFSKFWVGIGYFPRENAFFFIGRKVRCGQWMSVTRGVWNKRCRALFVLLSDLYLQINIFFIIVVYGCCDGLTVCYRFFHKFRSKDVLRESNCSRWHFIGMEFWNIFIPNVRIHSNS